MRGAASVTLNALGFKPVRDAAGTLIAEPIGRVLSKTDFTGATKAAIQKLEALRPWNIQDALEILPQIKGSKLTDEAFELLGERIVVRLAHAADPADVLKGYQQLGRLTREHSPDLYRGLDDVADETIGVLRHDLGLSPDDLVYRTTDPRFLAPDGSLLPNPNSVGAIRDSLDPVRQQLPFPVQGVDVYQARGRRASDVPGLFFGKEASVARLYATEGQVVVETNVRDLLEAGAKFYSDRQGLVRNAALYAAFDGSVPSRIVD